MTPEEVNHRIQKAFEDPCIIQSAIAKGVADARKQYALAGMPMAGLKDGKVIWVNPITLEEVSSSESLSKSN